MDETIKGGSMSVETKCNTDAVIQKMENISVLKNLRKQVEEGRTALLVSPEAINTEIENQRKQLEEEIAKCGSLEGVPEDAMAEIGIEPETDLENIEPINEMGWESWPE
jgi:hypothetical protein